MRVRLIKQKTIENFVSDHTGSKTFFRIWLEILKYADWTTAGDIQDTFGSADLLGNGSERVIFNIGGNHYRMICKYHFGKTKVHLFIKWIGTHADYTALCSKNKQYTIDHY